MPKKSTKIDEQSALQTPATETEVASLIAALLLGGFKKEATIVRRLAYERDMHRDRIKFMQEDIDSRANPTEDDIPF